MKKKTKGQKKEKAVRIQVVQGSQGPCIYVDDYRIAGARPLGGFSERAVLVEIWARKDEFRQQVHESLMTDAGRLRSFALRGRKVSR